MQLKRTVAAAALIAAASAPAADTDKAGLLPPLAPETLRVEPMPVPGSHWIYVLDVTAGSGAKVTLFDLDKQKVIGQFGAGFMPGLTRAADHTQTFVATSYFSRGTTGERTDVLEITDNRTFKKSGEVVLPPKHAQMMPSLFNTIASDDGKFIYVSNITPAASISVVRLADRKLAQEVDMAACVLAYPSGPYRFSSLCESGQALTITLDRRGREVRREHSKRFFDAENDPVFTHAAHWGEGYVFLSFSGKVTPADFSVSPARFDEPWLTVTAEERAAGWRPGGYQPFAIHRNSGRLYIGMHKGDEHSHKDGASEVWVFDLKTKQRIARWSIEPKKQYPMLALAVTQDDKPMLVGATGAGFQAFDAISGEARLTDNKFGKAVLQVLDY